MEKVKQDLQAEIATIQTLKNQEEDELQKLRQQKSQVEIDIGDLEIKRRQLLMEDQNPRPEQYDARNGRGHMHLTDDQKKSGDRGFSECDRIEEADTLNRCDSLSYNRYQLTSYNSETSVNISNPYHPYIDSSQVLATSTPLNSPADTVKVDNDVISLKKERSDLESQIGDMRIELTRLQTEVTGLENRKTILETIHRSNPTDELRTELEQMNGYGVGTDTDADFNVTTTTTEVLKPITLLSLSLLKKKKTLNGVTKEYKAMANEQEGTCCWCDVLDPRILWLHYNAL